MTMTTRPQSGCFLTTHLLKDHWAENLNLQKIDPMIFLQLTIYSLLVGMSIVMLRMGKQLANQQATNNKQP